MKQIALILKDLDGGGIQKLMFLLADALQHRGYQIDLLLCDNNGPFYELIPKHCRVIKLSKIPVWKARLFALFADVRGWKTLLRPVLLAKSSSKTIGYIKSLANYFRKHTPEVILTATPDLNVETLLARKLSNSAVNVVVSEHVDLNHLYQSTTKITRKWRHRFLPDLVNRYYLEANAIVAVSSGVAESLANFARLPRTRIQTIYNPVVPANIDALAEEAVDHPWFSRDAPHVILGVGRFHQQKDFPTLLRAFALVRKQLDARLVILGGALKPQKDAEYRKMLLDLASELGVLNDVELLGFKNNPYQYMRRAAVLAVSSIYEGFGNVIAEALACGCPVVSTDCQSGPAEILNHGEFGRLVPVRNEQALAQAIVNTIRTPPDTQMLRKRGQQYSMDQAVIAYEQVLYPAIKEFVVNGEHSVPR